jgi:uncharacterized surface protein with fasciclin (FAS1) repeats
MTASGEFPTFLKLIEAAGLTSVLRTPGPFTVAVPTEAAFAALPATTLQTLAGDPVSLKKLLEGHIVDGLITGDAIATGKLSTLAGTTLTLALDDNGAMLNGIKVLNAGTQAQNGVFYKVEALLPQT